MDKALNEEALNLLFFEARTHNAWLDKPVSDDLLHRLYDVVKWAPTSANGMPARFFFLRTPEAKARLLPALSRGNAEKTRTAPVTVIIAYDLMFYEKMGKLFPHNPGMRAMYEKAPELVRVTAERNSSLQGAYLMMAARALGLDCGPMSGFDHAKVDEEFFGSGNESEGSSSQEFFPTGHFKSNFICNLGHGDPAALFQRSPRLDFDEACTLL